jgi:hypothetical protein
LVDAFFLPALLVAGAVFVARFFGAPLRERLLVVGSPAASDASSSSSLMR